jgi:hypothetical protein
VPVAATTDSSTFEASQLGSLKIDGFELDHAELTPEHKKLLSDHAAKILDLLKQYPDSFISIIGCADATGTLEHNQQLGQQRADAVLSELKADGVPAEIMHAGSVGSSVLLVETKGPEPRNRRAEISFTARQFAKLPSLGPSVTPPLTPSPGPGPSGQWISPPNVTPPPDVSPGGQQAPSPATKSIPPGLTADVDALTEQIQKTADAVKKDVLVKGLRDKLAVLVPFMTVPDAKKAIDDAIDSLVKEGSKAGINAILQAITGKSATPMPDRDHLPPPFPQKDLKEQIFKGPAIPIPDVPKRAPRLLWDYRNGPQATYPPGATIRFTVVPPEDFLTLSGSKRVVLVADADRAVNGAIPLGKVFLESASPTSVEFKAPTTVGKYVIRVDVGMDIATASARDVEVKDDQTKQ